MTGKPMRLCNVGEDGSDAVKLLSSDGIHSLNREFLWQSGLMATVPNLRRIAQTFARLTDCCHEEFLDRVRSERRGSDSIPFGVFYENPNYLPTVAETSEEQFFRWG